MNTANDFLGWFFGMLLITVLVCLGVAIFAPAGSWYAVKYDVPLSHVTIEAEPHDCEFLHAPIGDKDCHYNRVSGKIGSKVYVSWVRETTEEAAERRLAEQAAREEVEQAREREFRGRMTQADHEEAARRDAQPEVYSPDAHGNTCLPHQRSENATGEFVCPTN